MDPLSDDEAERLDIRAFAAVARIREKRGILLECQKRKGPAFRTPRYCEGGGGVAPCYDDCPRHTYYIPTTDMIREEQYLAKRTLTDEVY